MLAYTWSGNVRELESTMHRAVLLSTGDEIDADAVMLKDKVSETAKPAEQPSDVGQTVASMERKLILDTMESTSWNRSTAATILGISIRTLRNKLKQYQDEGYQIPSTHQE